MLFTSPIFLFLFLPFLIVFYYLSPKTIRNFLLLFASLLFYAWGEYLYALVILEIIFINFFLGILIGKFRRRGLFFCILAVLINLGFLFYFKYFVLFLTLLSKPLFLITGQTFLTSKIEIHMPLGISFVVFHVLSYIFDIYYKKIDAEKNIFNFSLYILLFPHLIAGPIVRYLDIGRQIKARKESLELFISGVQRFILGLGKKVIIANTFATVADRIFSFYPQYLSTEIVWLALISYTLQIYFDFSGYSDMAIGLARMFGFEFKENFNYPYISRSIHEFWRRWHMSLSSWFRDYVYIPLGGSRKGLIRTCVNIFIVFALTGFWHGANLRFLFWGIYYGFFLILERLFLGKILERLWRPFSHFYALIVIVIGWLIFRIESLSYAFYLLKVLAGINPNKSQVYTIDTFVNLEFKIIFVIALIAATPLLGKFFNNLTSFKFGYLNYVRIASLLIVFLYSLMQVASDTYNPFIYFRF